jgi:ABC-type multidrug transport system fused ATPase/permease subunit
VDLETDETEKKLGSILVDRKNIEEVPLSNLRKKIFLIPQEPILLNGNLIFNMDPLMQYKDNEILGSLKKSKLWDLFFESLKETQAMQTLGGKNA